MIKRAFRSTLFLEVLLMKFNLSQKKQKGSER